MGITKRQLLASIFAAGAFGVAATKFNEGQGLRDAILLLQKPDEAAITSFPPSTLIAIRDAMPKAVEINTNALLMNTEEDRQESNSRLEELTRLFKNEIEKFLEKNSSIAGAPDSELPPYLQRSLVTIAQDKIQTGLGTLQEMGKGNWNHVDTESLHRDFKALGTEKLMAMLASLPEAKRLAIQDNDNLFASPLSKANTHFQTISTMLTEKINEHLKSRAPAPSL